MNFDSPGLFFINGSEAEIQKLSLQIQKGLKKSISKNAYYQESWRVELESGAKNLKRADYWQFRLLHNQFNGIGVLGLPTLVRAARYVIKKIKKVKK